MNMEQPLLAIICSAGIQLVRALEGIMGANPLSSIGRSFNKIEKS